VPLFDIPDAAAVEVSAAEVDPADVEDAEERACPLAGLDIDLNPASSQEEEEADNVTVAGTIVIMLDWMGDHKSTWASAEAVWSMLGSTIPSGARLCVFSRVKAILVAHLDGRLTILDVCPCGYTVFTNCTSGAFSSTKFRNAHRTACPRPTCRLSRYLPGVFPRVARKIMYYLGVADWMKDCYNRPDLVDFLRNDEACAPPGSLQQSHGWRDKVVDNPVMQSDVRHLALVGTADSVPYFKDKTARGGVPVMLRIANLPPELQLQLHNCHLAGIMPNEIHVLDDEGASRRVISKNSTLYPILLVLADELCNLYVRGCQATDSTRPIGHPDRLFILRCVLLFWSLPRPSARAHVLFIEHSYTRLRPVTHPVIPATTGCDYAPVAVVTGCTRSRNRS